MLFINKSMLFWQNKFFNKNCLRKVVVPVYYVVCRRCSTELPCVPKALYCPLQAGKGRKTQARIKRGSHTFFTGAPPKATLGRRGLVIN